MTNEISFCSGFGQLHTNEADPKKPNKKLTPYPTITPEQIKALVDNPPSVDKAHGQWFIPSTLLSRTFKNQEQEGRFYALWADFDKNPPPISLLKGYAMLVVLNGADFELYNTRSATLDNQKSRLIVFLDKPLCYADWTLAQQILNDQFETMGVIPDRSNERAAQLCYLPNRGDFYGSASVRS
ncbi:MAG: hypothetical protein PHY54_11090 [Methylococcales bacterium]|nr:hypothetical protein [Methylococcales bacterium]